MKREINILRVGFIGVVFAVVIGLCIFFSGKGDVDYTKLTEVRIKQTGTMNPTGSAYALTRKNGTWVASHNRIGWSEDSISETEVDAAFADAIIKILEENKAHKWDDFNIKYEIKKKLRSSATDGNRYAFYMCFSDGTKIEIEEYNTYPAGYKTAFEAIENRYEQLFRK